MPLFKDPSEESEEDLLMEIHEDFKEEILEQRRIRSKRRRIFQLIILLIALFAILELTGRTCILSRCRQFLKRESLEPELKRAPVFMMGKGNPIVAPVSEGIPKEIMKDLKEVNSEEEPSKPDLSLHEEGTSSDG